MNLGADVAAPLIVGLTSIGTMILMRLFDERGRRSDHQIERERQEREIGIAQANRKISERQALYADFLYAFHRHADALNDIELRGSAQDGGDLDAAEVELMRLVARIQVVASETVYCAAAAAISEAHARLDLSNSERADERNRRLGAAVGDLFQAMRSDLAGLEAVIGAGLPNDRVPTISDEVRKAESQEHC